MNLYASSFVLGELQHPNRMPFSGVLTWLNAASDRAPIGSGGLPVYISADVGLPALTSLVGMAVNYVPHAMDGHNTQLKIGVIDAVSAGEPDSSGAIPINISGYIFAEDFQDAAVEIKLNQSLLGFSYETTLTKLSASMVDGVQVAKVDELGYFTGASILFKAAASYQNTSLAASTDSAMDGGDKLDNSEILAAISALREYIDSRFTLLREQQYRDSVVDSANEYVADAVEAVVEASETLDEIVVDAVVEEVVEDVAPNADVVVVEIAASTDVDAVTEPDLSSELAGVRTQLEAANAELEQLKSQAPARKSVTATSLMAKFDVDDSTDYTQLIACIDARTDLSVEDRLALKMEARTKNQNKK